MRVETHRKFCNRDPLPSLLVEHNVVGLIALMPDAEFSPHAEMLRSGWEDVRLRSVEVAHQLLESFGLFGQQSVVAIGEKSFRFYYVGTSAQVTCSVF